MTPEAVKEMARAGRPRSAEADTAILEAATELFCELGYDALSVEAVAARAGVSKTTIYRRYPTKVDLVLAASLHMGSGKPPVVETGVLRTDLLAVARSYHRMLTESPVGRAIPMMIAARSQNPELARAHDEFVAQRRATTIAAIGRAVDRGDLPAGTDPAMVSDLLTGPIFLRVFVTGQPITDGYLEQLVDSLLI